jgi:hypothetical protein
MKKLLVTFLLILPGFPLYAAVAADIFGQSRTHITLIGGNGYAFNNDYFVVGASASYYLIDGLGIGVSAERWMGGDPGISKYAPFVQYVFPQVTSMRPYIGGFYRHTAINTLPDINSVGGRAGVYLASGGNAYVSVGIVYESYLDCQASIYSTCSYTYPDFSFTIGF